MKSGKIIIVGYDAINKEHQEILMAIGQSLNAKEKIELLNGVATCQGLGLSLSEALKELDKESHTASNLVMDLTNLFDIVKIKKQPVDKKRKGWMQPWKYHK